MLPQQYCLRWKYHHSNLQTMFSQLLDRGCFCDVTLACEGQLIRAHRVVLCACSTFFDTVLSNYANERDPIIIMKDVTFAEVKCLIEFMYKGEINVEHASLPSLLKTADDLKIKGLAEVSWRDEEEGPPPPMAAAEFHSPPRSLAESYAQDMLQQQQQQQQQQKQQLHTATAAAESPAMESVLGLVSGRLPALTPIPGANSNIESAAPPPVEHFMAAKRKRGRPPLDDAYDVFNVRKLAQYAANLEPAQRAYLESASARHFSDESSLQANAAACLASPPAAYPPLLSKQRQQRLRQTEAAAEQLYAEQEATATAEWQSHNRKQQQQQQQLQAEAGEPSASTPNQARGELEERERERERVEAAVDIKHDISSEEAALPAAANSTATCASAATSTKRQDKAERRERHGKLRHASRRSSGEREKSAEKLKRSQLSSNEEAESAPVELLPQPVEEIENEHLVANRADSPASRPTALLHPSSFGKYAANNESGNYMINEHGLLLAHDFAPNVAAVAAAAAAASATNGGGAGGGGGDHGAGNVGEFADIKIEDYDTAELRLTNEELSQWQDVIKMDDYLAKGRRPQFWEEPFTKRVLDAIKNKRLEMKKAARILGVSYGTLYGRYREVYGCLKHPYSGSAFRNSSASSAATQLAVQSRFDLTFRNGSVLPAQLELGKLRHKDLSELWTRPQI